MNCNHEHVKPAGFPMDALICTNCKRIIDPDKMKPLEVSIVGNMKLPKVPQKQLCSGCLFYAMYTDGSGDHCSWPKNRLAILQRRMRGLYVPDKSQFYCWTSPIRETRLIEKYERRQGYLDKAKWMKLREVQNERGKGPDGLYCGIHANILKRGDAVYTPDGWQKAVSERND